MNGPVRQRRCAPGRGFTLVEMLVGLAIGMFIVAAAVMVATTQLFDNRRLMLETQINQDMRATVDLIARELRQAGYQDSMGLAVRAGDGSGTPGQSAYVTLAGAASTLLFQRQRGAEVSLTGSDVRQYDGPGETMAFQRVQVTNAAGQQVGVLQMRAPNGTMTPLTDPSLMDVTEFQATPANVVVSPPCGSACSGPEGSSGVCLNMRPEVVIKLAARAVAAPNDIRRVVTARVRPRNDVLWKGGVPC